MEEEGVKASVYDEEAVYVVALLMACAFSAGQDEETITFDSNQRIEDDDDEEEEDDAPGKRALHLVAAGGGPLALLFLLLVAGARVDAEDKNGNTALILACEIKHAAAAAELMEATKRAGALDLQDQHEISALHFAADVGLAGTVAKLLALGADATLTDKVRASISVYRYQRVLICTRTSTNTLVCNTAWKPERSSLVSFLIVRDNTGQARTSLDPASGH